MAVRQFLTGFTHTLYFSFFDDSGARTNVDSPQVTIYTPEKSKYADGDTLTLTATAGKYQYSFFAAPGITSGHWFAMGVGATNNDTIYSAVTSFEITDIQSEPFWVGLEELRDYLELSDTDNRSDDKNLKQALQSAIELVEGYTNRSYGLYQYDETIQIINTERVKLKHFPIYSIVGVTATYKIIPRDTQNLVTETLTNQDVSFYYRLDADNGVLYLTDSAGFDLCYEDLLLGISYIAGYADVPEPVRQAVLSIAATLNKMSCTEGLSTVRLADVSFTPVKNIIDGVIKDLLAPYRNNCQV